MKSGRGLRVRIEDLPPRARAQVGEAPKRSKYGNTKVTDDGHVFDSKAEHKRYCELRLLEKSGAITALSPHPKYEFKVNGVRVGSYTPDFRYLRWGPKDLREGVEVIEDVKGVRGRDLGMRLKLMKALFGIDVVVIAAYGEKKAKRAAQMKKEK